MWKSLAILRVLVLCEMCILVENKKQNAHTEQTQTNSSQVSVLFNQLTRGEGEGGGG